MKICRTSLTCSPYVKNPLKTNEGKYVSTVAKELAKLAPSVGFKAGNSYSTAKSGKTLTVKARFTKSRTAVKGI